MKQDRKTAREFVQNIKTRAELEEYFEMLNIKEDEREIALLFFGEGWTKVKIALKLNLSESAVKKKLAKVYSKMV